MSVKYRQIMSQSGIAVLLACLVGALIYYLPMETEIYRPAFSFVWASGDNSPEPSQYNLLINRFHFEAKFYFTNGTGLSIPNMAPPFLDQGPGPNSTSNAQPLPAYRGEIDATSLATIGTRRYPWIPSLNLYRFENWELNRNVTAKMYLFENRSFSVLLISGDVTTDMGIHNALNTRSLVGIDGAAMTIWGWGGDWQSTEYFAPTWVSPSATWNITTNELCKRLPASGTAKIEFHASISIDVNYNITINDELKTGHELLSWNGILGTYQLYTDQGKIISVKYDFISVFLFLQIEK